MKRIGIVGGGQLGRMMAQESKDLDVHITVLDPTPNCPASALADEQVIGDFGDKETVLAFGRDKDVLTFEIESANAEALIELEEQGIIIHPSPKTLFIIKDKFAQKEFLTQHQIPVAPYKTIETKEDVEEFGDAFGYPLVLKSRRGAYDGRGNRTVENADAIETAIGELGGGLYVEAWIPFIKELAVVAARGVDGTIYPYPVVETVHTDHICDIVTAPADVSAEITKQADALARKIMEIFHGAGVFGIEMFLTKDGELLINEIAPRVHNSGHWTLGGATISQFAQHMRAVCGEILVEPKMLGPAAVMKNILGTRTAPADPQGIKEAEALGANVQIYGKHETKIKRKMGHLTVVADTREEALRLALQAHSKISI
jgi:phosphoribosylaminoimidazole carboxylase PurK protein